MRNRPAKTRGDNERHAIILVVNDVEETRDGLQELLTGDGYHVNPARSEDDAVRKARADPPDLILMTPSGSRSEWIAIATRIREKADLRENIPVVVFCVGALPEGAEVEIERSIYLIRPDNFNQLRECLNRLLHTAAHLL